MYVCFIFLSALCVSRSFSLLRSSLSFFFGFARGHISTSRSSRVGSKWGLGSMIHIYIWLLVFVKCLYTWDFIRVFVRVCVYIYIFMGELCWCVVLFCCVSSAVDSFLFLDTNAIRTSLQSDTDKFVARVPKTDTHTHTHIDPHHTPKLQFRKIRIKYYYKSTLVCNICVVKQIASQLCFLLCRRRRFGRENSARDTQSKWIPMDRGCYHNWLEPLNVVSTA